MCSSGSRKRKFWEFAETSMMENLVKSLLADFWRLEPLCTNLAQHPSTHTWQRAYRRIPYLLGCSLKRESHMSGESLLWPCFPFGHRSKGQRAQAAHSSRLHSPAALTARLRSILVLHSRKACSLAKKILSKFLTQLQWWGPLVLKWTCVVLKVASQKKA